MIAGAVLMAWIDLTPTGVPHRLHPVHRVFRLLVAAAMLSTSGSVALQHVHAYSDHDHADHHHGPASHAHGHAARVHRHGAPDANAHPPHGAARLEDCDPGEHAVSLVFTYVAPQSDHVLGPVTLATIVVTPPEQAWRHAAPSDVRAHSPPRLTDAPLRAPPVVHPA